MSAAASLPAPGAINSSAAGTELAPVERRCENADCNAAKLLSMVPKRKTHQFVTEPTVMERPMLINGFTTVFQVDGNSAKLLDLKSVPSSGVVNPKVIYRIVPNTHAHIVNYVVVDAEGESLRKINKSDPATMRKLLESQKVSADQMLKKLIAGANVQTISGGGGGNSNANVSSSSISGNTTTTNTATASIGGNNGTHAGAALNNSINSSNTYRVTNMGISRNSVGGNGSPLLPSLPTLPNVQASAVVMPTAPAAVPAMPSLQQMPLSNAQIQLPVRMHPNLKITAVASADTVVPTMSAVPQTMTGMLPTATVSAAGPLPLAQQPQQAVPLITPVPLSALQSAPVLSAPTHVGLAGGIGVGAMPAPIVDAVERPVFDKMQAELQELRRTVALLAEAQAKNLSQQQQQQQPQPQQSIYTSPAAAAAPANIIVQPSVSYASTLRNAKRLRQN